MKILVVDDIGYSRRSVAMVLQRHSHIVVEAKSGAEALVVLKSDHSIDLVITDLIMDDLDGVELCLQAKRLERMNDEGTVDVPPFVLLTAAQPGRPGTNKMIANRLAMAQQIGFVKVLFKPLEPDALMAVVEKIRCQGENRTPNIQRNLGQIRDITNAVIEAGNQEAAASLLECLEERASALRELAASQGTDK